MNRTLPFASSRRATSAALALGLGATAFFGIAAAEPVEGALHACEASSDDILVVEGEAHQQTVLGAAMTFPMTDTEGEPAQARPLVTVSETYAMNFVEGNRGSVTITITWDQPSDIDLNVYDADGAVVGNSGSFNIDSGDHVESVTFTPDPCATYTVEILNNIAVAQDITISTEVTSKAPRS